MINNMIDGKDDLAAVEVADGARPVAACSFRGNETEIGCGLRDALRPLLRLEQGTRKQGTLVSRRLECKFKLPPGIKSVPESRPGDEV